MLRLADITRAVLGGATPGVEVEIIAASDIEQLFFGDGVSADLRMKWSGDIPLGDVLVDPQPGILRSLSEGPALIQLLLDVASIRSKEGNLPGFWFSGRVVCTGTSTRRRLAGISGALGQLAGVNRLLVGEPCKLSDGQRGKKKIGNKPGNSLARADKQDSAYWRQQRPQADATGRNEVAHTPLGNKGHEEYQRDLDQAKGVKIQRFHVDQQIADQQQLKREGDG